jgi:hypothetical protein
MNLKIHRPNSIKFKIACVLTKVDSLLRDQNNLESSSVSKSAKLKSYTLKYN